MSRGPEAVFKDSIRRHLQNAGIYVQGMAERFSSGTPDHYNEGPYGCLWIEYKYVRRIPKTMYLNTMLSAKQLYWLLRADTNHVPVAVVVGCKDGGIYVDSREAWEGQFPITKEVFLDMMLTRSKLAKHIVRVLHEL